MQISQTKKIISPYGSWKSPIDGRLLASTSCLETILHKSNNDVFWRELRPKDQGRYFIVRRSGSDGKISDIISSSFNARTTVHEYGGGAYTILRDYLVFSNFIDQQVYLQNISGNDQEAKPRQISPKEDKKSRYADYEPDPFRERVICIREDHNQKDQQAQNSLATISIKEGGEHVDTLAHGNDFYSSPRLSPDGRKLVWLTWNHPNMPWDGTELFLGELDSDGKITNERRIAGGIDEAISEPRWSPEGRLYFVSDRTGWSNIYCLDDDKSEEAQLVYGASAEFSSPQWVFAISSYAFASENNIVCTFSEKGFRHLGILDPSKHELKRIESPYTEFAYMQANKNFSVFIAASPDKEPSIICLDLKTLEFQVLYDPAASATTQEKKVAVEEKYLSMPESIEFPTTYGKSAFGIYYPPKNEDYEAPSGTLPPLIVMSHGGPTSAALVALNYGIQFWTSRGFGVLDINYRGSARYGREYMLSLRGNWGILDVDDCVNGAKFLAKEGKVDPKKLIIRGGSAGGYTTLCALAFRKVFNAGASYYGVSDLEALAKDTHKFESRYLDRLIGPYAEKRDLYLERSAINAIDGFSAPVILFQGLEDKVVLPAQSEMIFNALKKKGIPTAYIQFEGEQHGFRKESSIERAHEAELYFYSKIFGFELGDQVEPVKIENL
ncbi:MAG: prolyl oligopeptidase family serine peptidase [archaeon]|nr:prolyl oligopeptidase family serine peptidase [archaeon]